MKRTQSKAFPTLIESSINWLLLATENNWLQIKWNHFFSFVYGETFCLRDSHTIITLNEPNNYSKEKTFCLSYESSHQHQLVLDFLPLINAYSFYFVKKKTLNFTVKLRSWFWRWHHNTYLLQLTFLSSFLPLLRMYL